MNGRHARVVPELFDGDRLRQARIYKGLKKVDLAKAIEVTPAVVGQYESGKTRPSTSVFASIALHLGFGPEFFERRGPVPQVTEGQAHFRKLRSTSKLERDQALVRLEFFAEVLADVETHVQLPAVDLPEYPVDDGAPEAEPEAAAAAVRAAWGLGTGPIDNVVRLLEGRGIVVIRPAVGSSGVDAFSTIIGCDIAKTRARSVRAACRGGTASWARCGSSNRVSAGLSAMGPRAWLWATLWLPAAVFWRGCWWRSCVVH